LLYVQIKVVSRIFKFAKTEIANFNVTSLLKEVFFIHTYITKSNQFKKTSSWGTFLWRNWW